MSVNFHFYDVSLASKSRQLIVLFIDLYVINKNDSNLSNKSKILVNWEYVYHLFYTIYLHLRLKHPIFGSFTRGIFELNYSVSGLRTNGAFSTRHHFFWFFALDGGIFELKPLHLYCQSPKWSFSTLKLKLWNVHPKWGVIYLIAQISELLSIICPVRL